jgi:hypothetical protein
MLTVIGQSEQRYAGAGRNILWRCRCDCGGELLATAWRLRHGLWSCGCHMTNRKGEKVPVHGLSATSTGHSWIHMLERCYKTSDPDFGCYGGRGIRVCEFIRSSPVNLVVLVGLRPPDKHSIDRINNELHYSCGQCAECFENHWPMNLRWATAAEQARNRRSNKRLTFDGQTKLLCDWKTEFGLKPNARIAIVRREAINRGMEVTNG